MAKKFTPSAPATFSTSGGNGDEPFTDQNFLDRARSYATAHGGKWHTIRSNRAATPGSATPAQWIAWMYWFDYHKIPKGFKEQHGVCTVPSEWPEEFDPSFLPSDREAGFPLTPIMSREGRERMQERLRALAARMAIPNDRRPNNRVARTPDEVLADLKDSYAKTPPQQLSPELLHRMGYPRAAKPVDEDADIDF